MNNAGKQNPKKTVCLNLHYSTHIGKRHWPNGNNPHPMFNGKQEFAWSLGNEELLMFLPGSTQNETQR
jgi:hypothetical protein